MYKHAIAFVLCLCSLALSAQTVGSNVYGVEWENDGFMGSVKKSDEYYTNGLSIDYSYIIKNTHPLSSFITKMDGILSLRKSFIDEKYYSTVFSIKAAQNMYTPTNIEQSAPIIDDRPYAGWTRFDFYFAQNYYLKRNKSHYGISLGSLGDAGAGSTQTTIHTLFDKTIPQGWQNHIENRLAYEVYFGKASNIFYAKMPLRTWASLYNYWNIEMGNVFTRASYSLTLKLGLFSEPLLYNVNDGSLMKRVSSYYNYGLEPFTFNFYMTPKVFLSAYDGTIDARTGIAYDIEEVPVFLEMKAGIEMTFFKERIYFSIAPLNIRSVEFFINNEVPSDADELFYHSWGQLVFKFRV